MGVPALFRWLSQKYPKIITPVIEERPEEIDGEKIPVDIAKPNPNDEEFDNLYLDMNNIVHPCSHPEDRPAPANEQEMMLAVFEYTERIVNMVRPRKLLMIAVDGVAPRAKMNQQRSRRFRSAKEAKELDASKQELYQMMRAQGNEPVGDKDTDGAPKKTWDSNAITPGTPFMDILARSLRYWISYKLSTDPAWKNLKIIISDATVPGEGEHKIMQFVRSQRSSPTHDPNTRHVIYGLDADLIMLCLATHEPYFRVLREDVFAQDSKPGVCRKCNQTGHMARDCTGMTAKKQGEFDEKDNAPALKPFIWLHVGVLREYLAIEMNVPGQNFRFDLERALDDWVFMCFFVGNDFLPHLPSLEIREQGIDVLIALWRDNLNTMGGYLTRDGHVDLARAQTILEGLAKQEDAIFKKRREIELRKEKSAKRRKLNDERRESGGPPPHDQGYGNGSNNHNNINIKGPKRKGEQAPDVSGMVMFSPSTAQTKSDPRYMTHDMMVNKGNVVKANAANKSAAAVMKERLKNGESAKESQKSAVEQLMSTMAQPETTASALGKRGADLMDGEDSTTPVQAATKEEEPIAVDTVMLWEDGYADRYYEQKFKVSTKDKGFRHQVGRDYVEGLAWVLLYYFQGCPSWTWYYPHHYAPFAADFVDIEQCKFDFVKGKPFHPYEQLMGVLPAASKHAIPPVFHPLMTEPDSDIIDFYPEDFEIDLNGKKFEWQGVALLPFIDEKRLLDAMNTKYPELDEDEKARNAFGRDDLLMSSKHPLYDQVTLQFYSKKAAGAGKLTLSTKISDGLNGKVEKDSKYMPGSELEPPLDHDGMPGLDEDLSITVRYTMPPVNTIHKSMLLPGVKLPQAVLTRGDIEQTAARSQRTGREFCGVPLDTRPGGFSYARDDTYRPGGRPNGGHRGGEGPGFGNGNGMSRHSMPDMRNLPPSLAQQAAQHGILPPHMAGWQPGQPMPGQYGHPPLPPGHGQHHQSGSYYNGPPPPQNGYGYGYNGGNGNRGGHGGYQGGYGRR